MSPRARPGEVGLPRAFALVGAGRMGTALALALARKGLTPLGIHSRRASSMERARALLGGGRIEADPAAAVKGAPLVLLGVPDDALAPLADRLARLEVVERGSLWIHLSGFHGLEPLEPLARKGARILGIHPLQTVPDPAEGPARLEGAWFSLAGAEEDLPLGEALVRLLGGRPARVAPEMRPLYHAAAVLACNDLVALLHLASRLLERASRGSLGWEALLPLVRATLESLEKFGPRGALTGPVARGDEKVVAGHRRVLEEAHRRAWQVYRLLGLEALDLLGEEGEESNTIERILRDPDPPPPG